jgi:hypothetical protein
VTDVTTEHDPAGGTLVHPEVSAEGRKPEAKAQARVRAPARTREDEPLPPPPGGGARLRARAAVSSAQTMATGTNLLAEPPPALLTVWAKHAASARYYDGWLFRWPRFAYGAAHTWVVCPVLRFIEWALDSPPKALAVAGVIVLTLWLLGWL